MAGMKEFRARMLSDKKFAEKFDAVENDEQVLAIAKAEGYDLEQLDEEQLDDVAGGLRGPSYGGFYKTIKNLQQLITGGNKVY